MLKLDRTFFMTKTAVIRQFFHIFDTNITSSKFSISIPRRDYDKIFFVSINDHNKNRINYPVQTGYL